MAHNPLPAASSVARTNPPFLPSAAVSIPTPPAPVSPVSALPADDTPSPQPRLDLDPEGVRRVVWESRYGPILIEVVGDTVMVNGKPVEPACLPERSGG